MVLDAGIEPATSSMSTKRSPAELTELDGADGENRTRDLYLTKIVLYRLSYISNLADPHGLEPRPTLLESGMLPLHHGSMNLFIEIVELLFRAFKTSAVIILKVRASTVDVEV